MAGAAGSATLAVVIPVYQDPQGVRTSLASLAAARYPDRSVIILVDDGSEPPLRIDETFPAVEVRVVRLERNRGIEAALNRGFAEARGFGVRYIARLDAGDRVAPERFMQQYALLEGAPRVGIVGTGARFVDVAGRVAFIVEPPADDAAIRRAMHINCCLLHPTVMIRVDALDAAGAGVAPYAQRYPAAEDYDLFLRLLRVADAANLAAPLVDTMFAADGLSRRRRRAQLASRLRLQAAYFDWRFPASYAGLTLTLAMLIVPNGLVIRLKRLLGRSGW